ncbi:MAG: Smr/MutS family protein, partial [Clostridiales bacterium]
LLTIMGLAGLHIPADPGSELRCFDQVFADIGDEQSIEQSLSTFSSHMTNIVEILRQADGDSLVLLDELGAGTDPTEGAALAMAILKSLHAQGGRIVATTHYSELKAFAYNSPGFINASVEFDLATLSPTYRLTMGVPGKSNAFEISRRLGLSGEIIDEAAASLSSEDVAVTAMLADLEMLRREVAREKEGAELAAQAVREREKLLVEAEQKFQIKQAAVLRQANLAAQKILDETKEKSRILYQQAQEKMAEGKSAEKTWQDAQKKLKNWRVQLEEEIPEPIFAGKAPKTLKIGDYIFLPKLNQYGHVFSLPDSGGEVFVQVGVIKLKASLADIRLADEEKKKKPGQNHGGAAIGMRKMGGVEPEINLHGLDSMEAIHLLDKYIDDAFIAGLREVTINHGRGTGALRNAVQEYLRTHRLVKKYRLGELCEGGPGITIVTLNQ